MLQFKNFDVDLFDGFDNKKETYRQYITFNERQEAELEKNDDFHRSYSIF